MERPRKLKKVLKLLLTNKHYKNSSKNNKKYFKRLNAKSSDRACATTTAFFVLKM